MANRYRYPKGHPKAGQFQSAKEGARSFVRAKFDDIASGKVSIKNLTPQEKRIYAGLKGSDFGNRYTFGKQKFYDPTGQLKALLSPVTKGRRDLENFYTKEQIIPFLQLNLSLADKDSRQSFFKGYLDQIKHYQKKSGQLLDVIKLTEKFYKRGFTLNVIDPDGDTWPNAMGVDVLTSFERDLIEKAGKKAEKIQKTKNPFVRLEINYQPEVNVFDKTITIDLQNMNTNLDDPENTDVVNRSNS